MISFTTVSMIKNDTIKIQTNHNSKLISLIIISLMSLISNIYLPDNLYHLKHELIQKVKKAVRIKLIIILSI